MGANTPEEKSSNSEATRKRTTDKQHETNQGGSHLVAELQIPSGVIDEWKVGQKGNHRREKWRLLVEIGTLAVVFAYTYVAYHQWSEMRRATQAAASAARTAKAALRYTEKSGDETLTQMQKQSAAMREAAGAATSQSQIARASLAAARNALRVEQRPWVGLQMLRCRNCRREADGSFVVGSLSAMLVNTGKTPAIGMTVEYASVSTAASKPIPSFDEIEKEKAAAIKKAEAVPPNLPQEIATEEAKTMALVIRKMTPSKEVLAPYAHREITIAAGFKQGPSKSVRLGDQNVIYGLGKITYYDTSHATQHTTMFCVMDDYGTGFRYCPSGNQMN